MRTARSITLTSTLALVCACAPDLSAGDGDMDMDMDMEAETETMAGDMGGGPQVEHTDEGDGVYLTRVDATSDEDWIYLDLANGAQLEVSDPQADKDWDLGFQRFHIKLNGGASGSAGVEAALLEDTTFDDVKVAPADGYLADQPDGDDDNDQPDYVLQDWYDYNIMTHVLTPTPTIYVVRTADMDHYKFQIEAYYDDAGTSGHMTFRWTEVEGP
ncbi:MAG: HmuY family protein [Myxococcota bacterium]